mgnify:CR=1 FL=1
MSSITEHQLINIAVQIEAIAESNNHYTAALAARINATGKHLEQLTIAEFIALDNQQRAFFNKGVEAELSKGNLDNDFDEINALINSESFATIQGITPQINQSEQAKEAAIIQLCLAKDNGAIRFYDDSAEGAFYVLLGLVFDDMTKEGEL